jgi:hypothetical protein
VLVAYRFGMEDPHTGGVRRFVFEADVPYPHVPRIGEGVVVPTIYRGEMLGACRIERVIYDPYGMVILDLAADGLVKNREMQIQMLLNAGFREIT